ncbi:acyl-CoA dehydrogenase [Pararobbsia alpina]|uniref:3-methylmercaptopropionyl-CoA dehydrogenase n=1 Tax=Pararobbsia alpina TaxID=621374 RepID=A0A6S7AY51_9BURK|nr:acyl-CoA dehydrogenase [Pararobbsia alpina]CAB3781435.1 3-methylmercaptopropionyl-CoA dehydrogenase [Pararobbsia alpina]
MSYQAPVKDMLFVLNELAGLPDVAALPGFEDAQPETVHAVLEESARFNREVIAPLNVIGDRDPSAWREGKVTTSPGFGNAFRQFGEGGWQGVPHPLEFGGQGLPKLVATACTEMLNAANLSFALCPLLTDGAIEALMTAGSDEQKARYVPKLISGEWTGTMNLTEPQAGSDLALVRTRAEPQGDGSFKLFGTKIFITYGEHDMAANIVHFVLARTPGAPEGVKGISLFVVPKFLVNADGSLGERNDVHCVSIEHKLGIKASPTAVLQYGDQGGAIGHLIGEEHHGLEYMFIMMNAARFAVGTQGVGVADRAYQKAAAYAKDRVQSRPVDGTARQAVAIIHHPDVRRMLLTMRALTEGARALSYYAAGLADRAHASPDEATRRHCLALYEFLVPIVKGWGTELSVEVASLGIQVHGGMGFIEETGAAQYYRDARILPIYEGTTAIQANDLVGRKTLRDGGAIAKTLLAQIAEVEVELAARAASGGDAATFEAMRKHLAAGREALANVVEFVVSQGEPDPNAVFAGSVSYLKLAGIVLGGWQMARALLVADAKRASDPAFFAAKIATAAFFASQVLSQAPGIEASIVETVGDDHWLTLPVDAF